MTIASVAGLNRFNVRPEKLRTDSLPRSNNATPVGSQPADPKQVFPCRCARSSRPLSSRSPCCR